MAMQVNVYAKDGTKQSAVSLPAVFSELVREEVIARAVLAHYSRLRQAYGASPLAGKKHSVDLSKRRRDYRGVYGHGISRVPRKIHSRSGTQFNWVAAFSPGVVGGRNAHPPKAEKIWEQNINKKERRLAIRSAIAATADKNCVARRGHLFREISCALDASCESLVKTSEVLSLLKALGLGPELERVAQRNIRAGHATMRGRRYRKKVGPLVVVSGHCPLVRAASGIAGVNVISVDRLHAAALAPGCVPGRLTVWTAPALEKLDKGLFV